MAFCKQCGTDMQEAKFCPQCGASAEGVVAQAYNPAPVGADVRQRSLADFEHMTAYFGAKADVYNEFDAVCEEVESRKGYSSGLWIGGTIVCALIAIIFKAWFFWILAGGCVALAILLGIKNKKKLEAAQARQEELLAELDAYYKAYGYCPVGFEYTKPATLAALFDMIRKGRATNPADAINIYLADLRAQEMLDLQREATEAAKETAAATKSAARSARRAAGYSAASFWFK